MRTPAFQKTNRYRKVSSSYSLPPPTGGWNGRDSIFSMPESDAVTLNNWFPDTTDIVIRQGWADHVTGIGAEVESLMPYNEEDGTQTLFCAASSSFYDVTSVGAVGAAVQGSLSNARWQTINQSAGGTNYLCCFNGVDSPRYWNGSSWTTITGASSPAITGLTTTDIVSAFLFKRRMYLIAVNSLKLYYLPPDSVGGAASSIDLSGYFSRGGYIQSGETWTVDGGDGVDDYLCVCSSEGQVAVFQGTNPASSSTWGLVGVWNMGEPIGRRCMMKYRGDVLLLTVEGVFPLSKALQGQQLDLTAALTDKIRGPMRDAASLYRDNSGWQMTHYPQGSQLLLNVPLSTGEEQYVMNTITGSWGRYSGITANCWGVFGRDLYYGGNGIVAKFGSGVYADGGVNINTDLKQAFSYFNARGRVKHVEAVRPNFIANGAPSVVLGMAVDYGNDEPTATLSFTTPDTGVWDVSEWDNDDWGGSAAFNDWQTIGPVGTALALRMKTQTAGVELRFQSSDYVFEYGGVIV
jgi:hypothetical protein